MAFETKIGATRIHKDVQSFNYYSGCILISRSSGKKLEKSHLYNSRRYSISSELSPGPDLSDIMSQMGGYFFVSAPFILQMLKNTMLYLASDGVAFWLGL